MKSRITAIILAGGKGKRMHSDIPKQYLPLRGKPVLFYSLQAFSLSNVDSIVLVTGSGEEEYCKKEIIEKYNISKVSAVVAGGTERYRSVYQGIIAAEGSDYVLIHDGARPLITCEIIQSAINTVLTNTSCVVGVPARDTIQITTVNGEIAQTPNRDEVWHAQTPQSFPYTLVREAYEMAIKAEDTSLTDDAMVVRKYKNEPVYMINGDSRNIKITTPEDVKIAETLFDFFC